jgi:uncharacterized protein YnzC (UPF0291/DUF896 family)
MKLNTLRINQYSQKQKPPKLINLETGKKKESKKKYADDNR